MCIRWKVLNFNILNGRAVCFAMHMSERRVVITHRQQEVKLAIVSMLCNSLLRACTSILSLFSNYTNSSAVLGPAFAGRLGQAEAVLKSRPGLLTIGSRTWRTEVGLSRENLKFQSFDSDM
jgi:hypothetical protein